MPPTVSEIRTHNYLTKPPWAAYVWTDDRSIWLELPCPVGKAPVVVQYPRTEAGFAKAVALVEQSANIKRDPPLPGWYRHGEAKPKITKKVVPSLATQPTALRDALAKVLAKRGQT